MSDKIFQRWAELQKLHISGQEFSELSLSEMSELMAAANARLAAFIDALIEDQQSTQPAQPAQPTQSTVLDELRNRLDGAISSEARTFIRRATTSVISLN